MSSDSSRYIGMTNIRKVKIRLSAILQRLLGVGQGRTESQMERDGAIIGILLIVLVVLAVCVAVKIVVG